MSNQQLDQRRDEVRALSRLAFEELAGASSGLGEFQRAIAARAFRGVSRGVGPAALPAQRAYEGITGGVYAALRGATRLLGRGVDVMLRDRPSTGPPLSATSRGGLALGALQGLIGDVLAEDGSPLAQPMAIRVDGYPVPPVREAIAASFPSAASRLVVFLHGLMETEHLWGLGGGPSYGERLANDLGSTAMDIRYNTGRHISENGRTLSELLEAVVSEWPVEVEEIALVGHSMGGLVARSACHTASEEGSAWVRRVRHVVSLGTPHMGAPLEQAAHYASAALGALPETRPLARFLRRRSAGIRDLRQGSLVDEDWRDRDPDALRAAACAEVPLLEGATHCFVSATVTRSPEHPLGRLVGDWLVLVPSASGRGRTRRIPFREEDGLHVGDAHHLALLNHPAVYEKLCEWLSAAPISAPSLEQDA
jgi:pimeloyl-ACP methyl ester carboxylesterase